MIQTFEVYCCTGKTLELTEGSMFFVKGSVFCLTCSNCRHARIPVLSILVKSLSVHQAVYNSGTTGPTAKLRQDLNSAGPGDCYWQCCKSLAPFWGSDQ